MSTAEARYPVYFREQDLPKAYALLGELEGGEWSPNDLLAHTTDPIRGWTAEQISRAYLESPTGMKLIFDGMIDQPDEVLTSDDLARFLTHKPDADSEVVRGTMGAFANRCGLRYQRAKRDFPFEHWYVEGGFARYRMPSAVADVLRPLRDR